MIVFDFGPGVCPGGPEIEVREGAVDDRDGEIDVWDGEIDAWEGEIDTWESIFCIFVCYFRGFVLPKVAWGDPNSTKLRGTQKLRFANRILTIS